MANTLIPIQTYTLTSTASSVTFSNIPQNYTDLKIVYSGRDTTDSPGSVYIQFNGAGYNSTTTKINGTGSSVSSSSHNNAYLGLVPGPSQTANTFSNGEIYIPNYTSSTNKYFSSDVVNENDAQAAAQFLWTGLWANTAAITSVTLKTDQAFAVNSKFTLYGISNGVKATGGTLTVAGGYAYHTFTSTGSFLPNQQIKGAEILVIAGGGGGGADAGGGGGAGGVVYANSQTLNAGSTYTAVIGSGGAAPAAATIGNSGTNSVFAGISALGGGAGSTTTSPAGSGGSGGGGGRNGGQLGGSATQTSGTNYIGYGNAGGTGVVNTSGGGGGGAGAAGGNASGATAGVGGVGTSVYSSWHLITATGVLSSGLYYIAGGGGSGASLGGTIGAGGSGGGGAGGIGNPGTGSAGTANTGGGGGGGGGSYGVSTNGAAGGSGLIIVRYPLS